MAVLRITEYVANDVPAPGQVAMVQEPALTSQSVTYTTATQSSAFNARSRIVKLHPVTAGCYVLFGSSPTATASHEYLAPDIDHWRVVEAGHKVSAYDGTS